VPPEAACDEVDLVGEEPDVPGAGVDVEVIDRVTQRLGRAASPVGRGERG
jgi:hypothetical protein